MRTFDSNMEAEIVLYLNAYTAEMEKLGVLLDAARQAASNKEAFDARFDARTAAFCEATEFLDYWDLIYTESLIKMIKDFLRSEQLS